MNKIRNEISILVRKRKLLNHEDIVIAHSPVSYHFEQRELQAQSDSQTADENAQEKMSNFKVILDQNKI